MEQKIGKVSIKYDYAGNDPYENKYDNLLEICKQGNIDDALKNGNSWEILYHLSNMRENLLEFLEIPADAEVLEIGSECGALTGLLCRKARAVVCIERSEKCSLINATRNKDCDNLEIILGDLNDIVLDRKFDFVTLIGVLATPKRYIDAETPDMALLEKAKSFLKPGGKIILAIENRMGIKYLNGAREDHTRRVFSSINDYTDLKDPVSCRTYSKPELQGLLQSAGLGEHQFFYPMPDYRLPREIYSDQLQPGANHLRYYRVNYDMDRMYYFNESMVFDQVCRDQMFDYFANSFLVICNAVSPVVYAKYVRERIAPYRMKTEIRETNQGRVVEKCPLSKQGQEAICKLEQNLQKIQDLYVNCRPLQGELSGDCYRYNYLPGTNLDDTLFVYRNNIDRFLEKTAEYVEHYFSHDKNREQIFQVTEGFRELFGEVVPGFESYSLPVTNLDHVFHNIRLTEEGAYAFDYEWVVDFPVPHRFVIWRALYQLYLSKYKMYLMNRISYKKYISYFGFTSEEDKTYHAMEKNFMLHVRGKGNEERYTVRYVKHAYQQELAQMY